VREPGSVRSDIMLTNIAKDETGSGISESSTQRVEGPDVD
jgi:hypothetical protein